MAAEGELERERLLVVAVDVVPEEQLSEECLTGRGDLIRLAGPTTRGGEPPGHGPQSGGRQVTGQRPGRRARRRRGAHDAGDGARSLEASQRGVQRAVRDAPQETEGLTQPLLQLVAVQRLILE